MARDTARMRMWESKRRLWREGSPVAASDNPWTPELLAMEKGGYDRPRPAEQTPTSSGEEQSLLGSCAIPMALENAVFSPDYCWHGPRRGDHPPEQIVLPDDRRTERCKTRTREKDNTAVRPQVEGNYTAEARRLMSLPQYQAICVIERP